MVVHSLSALFLHIICFCRLHWMCCHWKRDNGNPAYIRRPRVLYHLSHDSDRPSAAPFYSRYCCCRYIQRGEGALHTIDLPTQASRHLGHHRNWNLPMVREIHNSSTRNRDPILPLARQLGLSLPVREDIFVKAPELRRREERPTIP